MGAMEHQFLGTAELHALAARALAQLQAAGFEQAQATASLSALTEVNVEHNHAALLRSTHTLRLALVGIVGGRLSGTELSDADDQALAEAVSALHQAALAAPVDMLQAVSGGQIAHIVQGPQSSHTPLLADTLAALLAWRAQHTPTTQLSSGEVHHRLQRSCLLSFGGAGGPSDIRCEIGSYGLGMVFSATEGERSSSFNFGGGSCHDLTQQPAQEHFALGQLMGEVAQAVHATPLSSLPAPLNAAFTGDVLLTPPAAASLLQWLLGQVGDDRLLSGTSMFRERVGALIASPLLTLASRFDAPGVAAVSADGFVAPAVTLVQQGRLQTLTPNLYTSRKLGLPHVPVAGSGWQVPAGSTPWRQLVADIPRGALVARLSMGMPTANGDFAGVVKNSFLINEGRIGPALAETMISGNVAQMLRDLCALSSERVDSGDWLLPWMRVSGLRFS